MADMMSDDEFLDSLLQKVSEPETKEETEKPILAEDLSANLSEEDAPEQDLAKLEEMVDNVLKEAEAHKDEDQTSAMSSMMSSDDSGMDLLASLDSIVQEIKGDFGDDISTDVFTSDMQMSLPPNNQKFAMETKSVETKDSEDGLQSLGEDKAKRRAARNSANQKDKVSNEKLSFGEKIRNLFFKVEIITPEEQEQEEAKLLQKKKDKEELKKAKAENNKKSADEKKEESKKKKEEAKEAARAKAELKAAAKKEKQEKKAELLKAREPEEVIRVRPVFVLFFISTTAALLLVVILLSGLQGYNTFIKNAERYLATQKYELAYKELLGVELKEDDEVLLDKAAVLMSLQKQYDSYHNFRELDMDAQALNSLVKGVESYDRFKERAGSLEVTSEFDAIYENIVSELSSSYSLEAQQAVDLYKVVDDEEYTLLILQYAQGNP